MFKIGDRVRHTMPLFDTLGASKWTGTGIITAIASDGTEAEVQFDSGEDGSAGNSVYDVPIVELEPA